jgi:hypothetical protein
MTLRGDRRWLSVERMSPRALAPALIAVLALLPSATSSAAVAAPPTVKSQATQRLATLVADTRALPRTAVRPHDKAMLLKVAGAARRAGPGSPCRAIALLRRYRGLLPAVQRLRLDGRTLAGASRRGALESDALSANAALLSVPAAQGCGGARAPRVGEATPLVLESDERHLRLRVDLPVPTFAAHQVGGTEYQQMFVEGMGDRGAVGEPVVPGLTKLFGVPLGANVTVRVNDSRGYDLDGVNLYPHQPDAVDQATGAPPDSDFIEGPFVKSARAYRSSAPFPRRPAHAKALGNMRNLRVGGVDTTGGQYRPRGHRLRVFTQIDVTVRFGGSGRGSFGQAARVKSVWESYFTRNYEGALVNWNAIEAKLDPSVVGTSFCGEDMLIVTSPALQPAAAKFATARAAAGYAPRVVVVGSDPGQIGTTLAQIQAYILGELNADCDMRPTYVVLFGDTANVPTWHVPCANGGDVAECSIPSDLPYSLNAPADLFADVLLGRIPAPDLASANAVVDKIVKYETQLPAPPGDDFFGHATVTSFFEQRYICVLNEGQSGTPNCNAKTGDVTGHLEPDYPNHTDGRGFTKTAERIQNVMAQQYGHTVDRVYTKGDDPQVIPEKYYDGTPIPPNLLLPGFPWDGDGSDLLNDYNDGRFAILHRDHGWNYGWAHPYLTTADTPSLANGTQLPVVFGVDCASATFDIPGSPSFVETQVMKPDGGAVAGFGDTQVSPTWPNNHMALGFFDAPFPMLLPNFGSDTPTKRLGDILLSGKGYVANQDGPGSAGTYQELYLYHLLGDPSGQMWSNDPVDIDVTKIQVEYIPIEVPDPGGPVFKVLVNMGDQAGPNTVVTLYRNGAPIGRGVVGAGGSVEVTPEIATPSDGLSVAFEQDGALPDGKAVDGAPSPTTPPGPADTSLTLRCPGSTRQGQATTFAGHLNPAFAGAQVRVRYVQVGTGGRSFEHTVATDPSGDWQDSATFGRSDLGDWHVTASFDGDASHRASSAECDLSVTR